MKYIAVDRLLTIDERLALGATLERIETFVRAVPVQPGKDAPVQPTDLTRYFNRGRLPIECYAMLKRLMGERNKMWRRLWAPNEDAPRLVVQDLEPLCRTLVSTVSDADWSRTVLNDFFKPFRKPAAGRPAQILPPENAQQIHSFFHTLRHLRNKSSHLGDISSEDVGLMGHLAYLYLVNRFNTELEEKLFTDGDFIEYTDADIPPESEAYDAASRYGRDTVPERYREVARATLAGRFASTVLAAEPDLASMLPRIPCRPEFAPQGITYLTGDKGSGKTTLLACMMLADPPRPLTFYIVGSNMGMAARADLWLRSHFMAGDFATLTPLQCFARLRWLDKAIDEGQVAVLFDACDRPRSWESLLSPLQRTFPTIQCIVAAEPTDDGRPPVPGAALSLMQPPGPAVARELMRLITTHTHNRVDLSHELDAALNALGVDAGSMQPLALTTLLDLLATDATAASQNYTALIHLLIQRLRSRVDIDEDKREELMQNSMFVRYGVERAEILALADKVHEEVYGACRAEVIAGLLDASAYMADAESRRTLFEHCHLMRDNGRVAALATLAAQSMFGADAGAGTDGLSPHPALRELAAATVTVPYVEPDDSDRYADHPELVFRPAPRYIVTQYILNLLRIYRSRRRHMQTHPEAVRSLLIAAATCGTAPVLDEIFRPYWLAQWLIPDGEKVCNTTITGGAPRGLSAPLRGMRDALHDRTAFAIRLFGAMSKLRAAGVSDELDSQMVQALEGVVAGMTDRGRLELLRTLQESGEPDKALLARLCNMIILSMDVPTASLYYSTEPPMRLPVDAEGLFDKFVKYPHTTPLLIKLTAHAAARNPARLSRIFDVLIKTGAYKGRYGSQFWKMVNDIMSDPARMQQISSELRRLPFADLSPRMAMRLYSPHVADFLLHRRETIGRERRSVSPRVTDCPQPDMLMPVSPFPGPRTPVNYLGYTVYERESASRLVIATEAVPDTVEGRYVRFDDGTCARIDRVIQPQRDRHATAYADITVVLPDVQTVPSRGFASLALKGCKTVGMPYVASYGRDGHRAVILRVDSPAVVETLAAADAVDGSVVFDGFKAAVAEVTVVPFARKQVMLAVSGLTDRRTRRQERLDIPPAGRYTIHYSPAADDKTSRSGIAVKLLDSSSRSASDTVADVFACGAADGTLLWGLPRAVSPGTLMVHSDSGAMLRVESCYVLANKDYMPATVLSSFNSALTAAYKRKAKPPYCAVVVQVTPLGGSALPDDFSARGGVIAGGFDLRWYRPVREPHTDLWDRSLEPPLSYGLFAAKPERADDGTWRLVQPYLPDVAGAAYMCISGIDCMLPAAIDSERRIKVPRKLTPLLAQRSDTTFYVRFYDDRRVPMRFASTTVAPLLSAGSPKYYPAELTDVVRPYLTRDIDSLRMSYKLFAAAGRPDHWCRMAMNVPGVSPGDLSRSMRVGVVWKTDGSTGRCLVLEQPAGLPERVDRPPLRWLRHGDLNVARLAVMMIAGDSALHIDSEMSDWLRSMGGGGFRHGTFGRRDGAPYVAGDDGVELPVRGSALTDALPAGSRVSYLVGYSDSQFPQATHVKPLS